MFSITTTEFSRTLHCSVHDHYIPLDPANRHYQEVLDAIITEGASCFDGDIPADIQEAADQEHFNNQLKAYKNAVARLAEYELAVGRPESTETFVIGETFDPDTGEVTQITEDKVMPAIDPLPATVNVTNADQGSEATTTEVENPLITKDNEERAAAQAVVDATPQAVKDAA